MKMFAACSKSKRIFIVSNKNPAEAGFLSHYRFAHWGRTFSSKTPYFRAISLQRSTFVESAFEMGKAISSLQLGFYM
jgi:hypothetical protein